MNTFTHPKSIRRIILTQLYEQYQRDPMYMLTPEDFKDRAALSTQDLLPNIHYLCDRGLVELMIGHHPPFFTSARITADGIDIFENQFEFDRRFPPEPSEREGRMAALPLLIEQLFVEADLSPLEGESRYALLRDIQFLRDEAARPAEKQRTAVITAVLAWISESTPEAEEVLPAATKIAALIESKLG